MKTLFFSLLVLSTTAAFADGSCKKIVGDRALKLALKRVSDDCSVRFVQESKQDNNLMYAGVSCDHTGSLLYSIMTLPQGDSCRIISVKSKVLDKDI